MSNAGMTAAAGFYQSVVGFLTLITANWVVTKIDSDSAMF
jgi:putative aldouronate transport system permease protein